MNRVKDAYCSFCGTAFPPPLLNYPRKCVNASCGADVYANPIPVSVVLAPVEHEGETEIDRDVAWYSSHGVPHTAGIPHGH